MVKLKGKTLKSVGLVNRKVARMLNDMADMFVLQTKTDVNKSKDVNGNNLRKLKSSTVRQKRKKGYIDPHKPLIASGKMAKVYRTKTANEGRLMSEVDTSARMRDIAEYHNLGKGNLPKRLWFGIGKNIKKRFDKLIRAKAKDLVITKLKTIKR